MFEKIVTGNTILNSCNDLVNIWHIMRTYGSLKLQMMVFIDLLVAKYAE